MDVGDGPIILINPQIVSEEGRQEEIEGCLSIPDKAGVVIRPETVKVKGMNLEGDEVEIEGSGFLARAFAHEIDHLDGVLFTDKVIRYVDK